MPMSHHQYLLIKQQEEQAEHELKLRQAELDAEKFKRHSKTDQDCPDGEVMVNGNCRPKEDRKKTAEALNHFSKINKNPSTVKSALEAMNIAFGKKACSDTLVNMLYQFVCANGPAQDKFMNFMEGMNLAKDYMAKKVENIPYTEEDLVPQLSEIIHLTWWQKIIRKIITL